MYDAVNLFVLGLIIYVYHGFKRLTREHESHNYLSFGRLFIYTYVVTDKKGSQMTNNCDLLVLLLVY